MALLWMDGLDRYGVTADLAGRYASAGTVSYQTTAGYAGGGAIRVTDIGGGVTVDLPVACAAGGVLHCAWWFKPVDIYRWQTLWWATHIGGSEGAYLAGRSDGGGEICPMTWGQGLTDANHEASPSLVAGSYNHIEIALKVDASAGYFKVWVNEVLVINLTGNTLASGTVQSIDRIFFGQMNWQYNNDIDDVVIWDESGTGLVATQLGKHIITTLAPTGNGSVNDFVPNTGTNYAAVDEAGLHDGDATKVVGENGNVDLYTFPTLADEPEAFYGVNVCAVAKATLCTVDLRCVSHKTYLDEGVSTILTVGYRRLSNFHAKRPNGMTWTKDEYNAAEFGVKQIYNPDYAYSPYPIYPPMAP